MTPRLTKPINPQAGAALITVMIMSVVIVSILASIFYKHNITIARVTKTLHGEQAALLALSGESWAISMLKQDPVSIDDLTEDWAVGLPILPVEGGSLSGQIEDLQARLHLNQFQAYDDKKLRADINNQVNSLYKVIERLARLSEQDFFPEHAATLIDWLDSNDNALSNGAEENEYLLKEPAYRPANNLLVETDELTLIEHFTPQLVYALSPFVNTLPSSTALPINVNTAPKEVLMALHEQIDESVADNLIELRAQTPWTNTAEFYDALYIELNLSTAAEAEKLIRGIAAGASSSAANFDPIGIKTNYFLLTVNVSLGTNIVQLESIINRITPSDVVVLARSLRFLPNTVAPQSDDATAEN